MNITTKQAEVTHQEHLFAAESNLELSEAVQRNMLTLDDDFIKTIFVN